MAVKRIRTDEQAPLEVPQVDPPRDPEEDIPTGAPEDIIRDLLAVPRTSGSIPTLTCIDKGIYKRYFILDVDGEAYGKAWKAYRKVCPTGTPEEFIAIVLRILSQGMPRMHRAVSYVPLV